MPLIIWVTSGSMKGVFQAIVFRPDFAEFAFRLSITSYTLGLRFSKLLKLLWFSA